MGITITPSGQACGASITGVDLSQPLADEQVTEIRAAWLEHKVLSFPHQSMTDDDLERFTLSFGAFGDDHFIAPIEGRKNIIAVERRADEKAPLFAENWHTDCSFQKAPPAGTCLYGIKIPKKGGDTLFANQQKAWHDMPAHQQEKYRDIVAIHSAKSAYSPEGMYGKEDQTSDRSMNIRPSEDARKLQTHQLVHKHPETSVEGFYSCLGYIVGLVDKTEEEPFTLLKELSDWQGKEELVYTHKWQPQMLVMWDNRALLHRATGGHEGEDRLLHRTTIAAY